MSPRRRSSLRSRPRPRHSTALPRPPRASRPTRMPACAPPGTARPGSDFKSPPPLSLYRIKVRTPGLLLGFFLVETEDDGGKTMKRIALITGGVGGIGTAICKRLARDGNFVVANYAIAGSEEKWNKSMAAAGLNGTSSALAFGAVTAFHPMAPMLTTLQPD